MKIKGYEIIESVGSGRFGTVYKAINLEDKKTYALKVLHQKLSKNSDFLGIFHREVLTLSRIKHSNIVKFYSSCFDSDYVYVATEFVDGCTIYSVLQDRIKVPPIVAICMIVEILRGVDYLHLHDIIHGDLSASNIMLSKHGKLCIADLGLAIHASLEINKENQGTPGYFSPEHITNRSITKKSDLYCIGILLYELIAGRSLFPPTTNKNKLYAYMGDLDFSHIQIDDYFLKRRLIRFFDGMLAFKEYNRISDSEKAFKILHPILKFYNIRYTKPVINYYFKSIHYWNRVEKKISSYYLKSFQSQLKRKA